MCIFEICLLHSHGKCKSILKIIILTKNGLSYKLGKRKENWPASAFNIGQKEDLSIYTPNCHYLLLTAKWLSSPCQPQ